MQIQMEGMHTSPSRKGRRTNVNSTLMKFEGLKSRTEIREMGVPEVMSR